MTSKQLKARCKVCLRHCSLVLTVTGEKVTDLALDPDQAAAGFNRSHNNAGLCRRARGLVGASVPEAIAALNNQEHHVIRLY